MASTAGELQRLRFRRDPSRSAKLIRVSGTILSHEEFTRRRSPAATGRSVTARRFESRSSLFRPDCERGDGTRPGAARSSSRASVGAACPAGAVRWSGPRASSRVARRLVNPRIAIIGGPPDGVPVEGGPGDQGRRDELADRPRLPIDRKPRLLDSKLVASADALAADAHRPDSHDRQGRSAAPAGVGGRVVGGVEVTTATVACWKAVLRPARRRSS
jgi:hypothetical protein